jgi:simple sugar transport system permease protein
MRDTLEAVLLPLAALAGALLLFGLFVWLGGVSPVETWVLLFRGAFGDSFSLQNTLQRAAPLMLTALAVALPAQAGLVVIGGEDLIVVDSPDGVLVVRRDLAQQVKDFASPAQAGRTNAGGA